MYLRDVTYPRMVIFEESWREDPRKDRKKGVKGPFQSQVFIGLNTNLLHPYAYLGLVKMGIFQNLIFCEERLTFAIASTHHISSTMLPL